MSNPLAAHPPWRQLLIITVVLPATIVLAILAFAWPAARIAPRNLPVGIVGSTPVTEQVAAALHEGAPGAFRIHRYANDALAESAIRHRDVYGAFLVTDAGVTVLEASAASPTVAQLLATSAQSFAKTSGHGSDAVVTVDVVPSSAGDPRGVVLSSALLPLTICSIIIASVIGLVVGFRPAWRQIMALIVISAVAGLGGFAIAQGFLGALPGEHIATWAALSLTLMAISSATAGLIALIGAPGFGLGAVLMVFIGNPFSGVTAAPQLVPTWVDHLGQWLPPGAGANLLRSTAYFGGSGAAGHLAVLLLWTGFGLTTIVIGHHTSPRFAAHNPRVTARQADARHELGPAPASVHDAMVGSGDQGREAAR